MQQWLDPPSWVFSAWIPLKKKKKVLIQILCANDIISQFLSFLDCKIGGNNQIYLIGCEG